MVLAMEVPVWGVACVCTHAQKLGISKRGGVYVNGLRMGIDPVRNVFRRVLMLCGL